MRRRSALVGRGLAMALLLAVAACAQEPRRPNIVLILVDDMGWRDAGYAGSDFYETPNIDRLAGEGMVFTQAYAAAANCSPSRASLLTGRYTPRHGVYTTGPMRSGPQRQMRLVPPPSRQTLSQDAITLAGALEKQGYVSGVFGKWHLGHTPEARPEARGFQVVELRRPPRAALLRRTNDPKSIYQITQRACDFIEANRERRFFAYVSHHATHLPAQARGRTLERFADKSPGHLHDDRAFAAMNAELDRGVGILLEKLESLGLAQDTLVVLTSDNGGDYRSRQTPLRGFKGTYYEGGIRVPLVARWPGVIPIASRRETPVHHVDLFPTFLEVSGAEAAAPPLDGKSLVPLLAGTGDLEREALYWHFPGYDDIPRPGSRDRVFLTRPVSVIRKDGWKLHLFHEEWRLEGGRSRLPANRAVELYDLAADPGEQEDLASRHPERRDALLDDLLAWIVRVRAPLATVPNPGFEPR